MVLMDKKHINHRYSDMDIAYARQMKPLISMSYPQYLALLICQTLLSKGKIYTNYYTNTEIDGETLGYKLATNT